MATMAVSLFMAANSIVKLNFPIVVKNVPIESFRVFLKPVRCLPVQQQAESGILCEPCGGTGWLLCDFCKGQKTNVKSETNKIYRRCPSCRAVGYILCSKCKVFKCVTFPNYEDGEVLSF
ncbi:uncharacterized protein LOC107799188 [Nicotiana tabacum]|uniref:Uncharacterized protein LOC107799188 n=1 Tax=Nicotiana tabacum TaxID=4097 RepID=A0A1S4AMB8_TOBAC|nr:PREDICTED: uncharacterized protein LOC107799188 [Nicotiana tabacum]